MHTRSFWSNVEYIARDLMKSSAAWGDMPQRTFPVDHLVNSKRDLRKVEDERHTFMVPELGPLGYPTDFAVRVDAQTGLATVYLT